MFKVMCSFVLCAEIEGEKKTMQKKYNIIGMQTLASELLAT
jgi:hypothetical protein